MISAKSTQVAEQARVIYRERLQADLETQCPGRYVAIEPDSGQHFLGETFSAAVAASRAAFPDRIAFVLRVGHPAALHIGGLTL